MKSKMREIKPKPSTETIVDDLEKRLGANALAHVLAIQSSEPGKPCPIADQLRLGVVFLGHALMQLPPYSIKGRTFGLMPYQLWNIPAKDLYLRVDQAVTRYEPNLSDIAKSQAYMPHRTTYDDYARMLESLVREDGQPARLSRGEEFARQVYDGEIDMGYDLGSLVRPETVRGIIGGGVYREVLLGEVSVLRKVA